MKNILFVIPAFTVGGTNTSLISLLPSIDKRRYNVFVYAMNPSGPMSSEVSKYCIVLNQLNVVDGVGDTYSLGKKRIRIFLSFVKSFFKIVGIDLTPVYYRRLTQNLSKNKFDCVIAFQEGEATRLVQYFENTRKVAWVRSAYARYLSVTQTPPEYNLYEKFDVIVNVSKTAMAGFLKVMPQFEDKSVYMYNLVNTERIISLSKQDSAIPIVKEDIFTIFSLGRVDKVKHFSDIPQIAKKLKENRLNFRWFIIGGKTVRYPVEYDSLKVSIEENGLQEQVIMLGHQANPYPYLAHGNLLVCLSESETFNHTFAEARTLGVPVLSVNYEGADEMLGCNQGGVITCRESICEELERIITDIDYYNKLKLQAERYSFDNEGQLAVFYKDIIDNNR